MEVIINAPGHHGKNNITWLRQLPYHYVSLQELQNDLGMPAITKADFVNNEFLNDLKTLYRCDFAS